ncbi:M18 family aminopeptidase [Treponema phagedenis]|uniref:M18 family aminopeptidase n=1 Tax=Treponema phagedenis TaxID=162 RepID=A0A0B7GVI8_TREPH|nr:M18 family aminopeptidase [Treponema phagedenis]NVP24854.1 M18 family aminopeptidase [Treponema phagedenis]QEJ98961.1 M18 family aminopeptidase [Treponema phagedenis]QEK01763.1 M18 family aminopeptidase [Treponema phagedenis]QKS93194.1 M18 family aminopeptidase [Treponema phagedenis]QLC59033.1 M18 family aminopeptidase [Treponema phagedenis]
MNKAQELINFIEKSPTVFHVIQNVADILTAHGYKQLQQADTFSLVPNGKYFITNNGSAIIAWQMGSAAITEGFRIIGSHSDSPGFRIKPNPEIVVQNSFITLNTEVYGGPILSTWFDRPLSIAGRVVLKGKEVLQPIVRLIDFKRPLLIIPNLAIHMNREVNEGYAYNRQKDTLPLLSIIDENPAKEDFLLNLIAQEADCALSDILEFDLFLYDVQKGSILGANNEFFSVGKIDNLGMAYASVDALVQSESTPFTKVVCIFDNEEVGSSTAQGAGSPFLSDVLNRIVQTQGDSETFQQALAASFLISADQAHGTHPNYLEKNDITNFPIINRGPAIKLAASMSYASDAVSVGVFKQVCEKANVPCQTFVNRSDIRGGSTIGPISVRNLNIKTVDVGNPILAMHSVRELGGVQDQESITEAFKAFYR